MILEQKNVVLKVQREKVSEKKDKDVRNVGYMVRNKLEEGL